MKNKYAVWLGRKAKGIPKTLTPEQRKARKLQMEVARQSRWPKKKKN